MVDFVRDDGRLAGTDGRKGKRFSLADLRGNWQRFDSEGGRLLHKQVAALCRANPMVTLASGAKVDVSAACPVFDKWNARATLDSKGAWLFSLWWANSGSLYRDAFVSDDRTRLLFRVIPVGNPTFDELRTLGDSIPGLLQTDGLTAEVGGQAQRRTR